MKVLDNLESLGYEIKVNEGRIKLSNSGESEPNKSKIVPLLEELKANKADVIKELQRGISEAVEPTIEKICKCGRPATDYAFDETENGKVDWIFFCNTCSPYQLDKPRKTTTAKNTDKSCLRCGKPGERYVFDETNSGKYQYSFFCLECSPYHL